MSKTVNITCLEGSRVYVVYRHPVLSTSKHKENLAPGVDMKEIIISHFSGRVESVYAEEVAAKEHRERLKLAHKNMDYSVLSFKVKGCNDFITLDLPEGVDI